MARESNKIHVEVVTPERRVLAQDVDEVILPGAQGSFGVLPGHTPMLAALGPGVAIIREGSRKDVLVISGGFAEVGPDQVTVLAETCERPAEIDRDRARRKVDELRGRLGESLSPEDAESLRRRLLKQQARVDATERAS